MYVGGARILGKLITINYLNTIITRMVVPNATCMLRQISVDCPGGKQSNI
jgi:hypothetical protein